MKPLPLSPYLKALLISAPIAVITGLVIDFQMLLPVSLFNLAVGLSILIYPFVVGLQERWHYLVLGVPIITVSLLPLITGTTLSHRLYGSGGALFYVAIGTACIVGGIIDHIRLVRNIRQVREALHA